MAWETLLAYITGTVDQELLLRNEYLAAENRIWRNQIPGWVRLTDGERTTLAELGNRLGKQALAEVVLVVKPETVLAWHRKLIAKKFDDLSTGGIRDRHDRGVQQKRKIIQEKGGLVFFPFQLLSNQS